jgi:hypothetical protein
MDARMGAEFAHSNLAQLSDLGLGGLRGPQMQGTGGYPSLGATRREASRWIASLE